MEILGIIIIIFVFILQNSKKNAKKGEQTNTSTGEKAWERAARENIENAARRAASAANRALNDLFVEEETTAKEQIQKRRVESRHTSILDRAKGNAEEKKVDVTLNTMEEEHNHSERISHAKHNHPEDVMQENMLGSVEDLMVKGYAGNLCFERDFVGEAMDMISRFTVPSDIPEYSDKKVS